MSEKRNLRGFWPGFFSGLLALPIVIVIIIGLCDRFLSTSEYDSTASDKQKEERVRRIWDSSNMLENATGVIFPDYTIDSVNVRGLTEYYMQGYEDDYTLEISFVAPFSKKTLNAISEKLEKEPIESKSETTEEGYPLHSSTRGWERLEDGRIKFSDANTRANGGYDNTYVTIDIKKLKATIEYLHTSH